MKQCPACKKLGIGPKDESEFHRCNRDGIQSRCKICSAAAKISPEARERYNADKRVQYTGAERLTQIERAKMWNAANPEKTRANSFIRRQGGEYKEKARARTKKWQETNPALVAAYSAHRRAVELRRTPAWADKEKIIEFYKIRDAAAELFERDFHVDHVIPLQGKRVSGLHVHTNLKVLPGIENLKKGNRFQVEFQEETRDLAIAA